MPLLQSFPQLKIIQQIARRRKVAVYLVGGFLRDYFLERPNYDLDFAVSKDALKFARIFANKIRGAYVLLDQERGCARVVRKEKGKIYTFDFADFRAKTFKLDLAHRDFTINTLAIDVKSLKDQTEIPDVILDFKKARPDLLKKIIRLTSVKAFKDDPLRMLRAFSLKAMLGFSIEAATLKQIKKDKDLLRLVSCERVRDELFKILETPSAASTLHAMDRIGLLEKVIPQVHVMYGCEQGGYHHLDVWQHSLETVAQIENVFEAFKNDTDVMNYIHEPSGGIHSRAALIKLGCLLHDIGKPETKKIEGERTTFHGHEHVGKNIVRHVARMLKLSTRERHTLESLVQLHLRPGYLSNFKNPSERAIYRYFRDAKDEAVSILLLSLADQYSTRGPWTAPEDIQHHEEICFKLIKERFAQAKEKPLARLINGHDLIRTLKLKPSPLFGKILKHVEENQSLGKITTKKEALALAKDFYANQKHSH